MSGGEPASITEPFVYWVWKSGRSTRQNDRFSLPHFRVDRTENESQTSMVIPLHNLSVRKIGLFFMIYFFLDVYSIGNDI